MSDERKPRTISLDADVSDEPETEATEPENPYAEPDAGRAAYDEPRERTRTYKQLEDRLSDLYTQVGFVLSVAGDNFSGQIIARRSAILAQSWTDLAERDPKVKRALDRMLSGGAWSGVIATHAMVMLPIAAYHNLIPRAFAEKVMLTSFMQDPEFFGQYVQPVTANGAGPGTTN